MGRRDIDWKELGRLTKAVLTTKDTRMHTLLMVVANGDLHFYTDPEQARTKAAEIQGVIVELPVLDQNDYRPWQTPPQADSPLESRHAHRIQNGWPVVLGQCGHWWHVGPAALLGWMVEQDPDLPDCPTCGRPPGVVLGTWRETWPDPSYRADLPQATETAEPAEPEDPPPPAVGRASLCRVPPFLPPYATQSAEPTSAWAGGPTPETDEREPAWAGFPVGHGLAVEYPYTRDGE